MQSRYVKLTDVLKKKFCCVLVMNSCELKCVGLS